MKRCRIHLDALYALGLMRMGEDSLALDAVVNAIVRTAADPAFVDADAGQLWRIMASHVDGPAQSGVSSPSPAAAWSTVSSLQQEAVALVVTGRDPAEIPVVLGVAFPPGAEIGPAYLEQIGPSGACHRLDRAPSTNEKVSVPVGPGSGPGRHPGVAAKPPRDWKVVDAVGEIDAATAPGFLSDLLAASSKEGPGVIADFAAVTFVGAAAVGALVEARARLQASGAGLIVRSPTPRLAWMLDLFGLADLVERGAQSTANGRHRLNQRGLRSLSVSSRRVGRRRRGSRGGF